MTRDAMTEAPVASPAPSTATPVRPASWHQAAARRAAGPLLTAVLSIAAAAQALRLWNWRPGIPLSLSGDSPTVLLQIRAILDSGWYGTNHLVGAPFGLSQSWFTTADVLNFAEIKAIGLFTDSPATAGAVFFVATFPLAALTAYWLARQLGVSRAAAVVVGVLFSVLPGHQVWFDHLWLAAYWVVPLAVWLIVQAARGGILWPSLTALRAPGPGRSGARWRAATTTGIVVAIGLADVYYVAFTLLLMVIVLLFRLGTGTRPRRLLPGAVATAAIATLCGASLFAATRGRGADQVTGALPAQRVIGESETYAGKLIELILPWYHHRVAPLRFLSYAYGVAAPPSVERPALGLVALVGVAAILWVALTALALGRRIKPLWGLLAALTLVSLGFYTRGGLGSFVALFVTPQIRTWSRFVVFIGLLGLLAVGLWLTAWARRRGRRAGWVVAALLIAVGVMDQTSPGAAPDYGALSAQRDELTAYTTTLSRAVGNCPVFQLPVTSFPEEPPPGQMGDYDHLLPALASPAGLTWSYGAIRGTARADWQLALPVGDQKRLMEDVAAAGFCAVEIDRDGYAGSSDPSSATAAVAGAPVAVATNAHLAAYDLRPLADGMKASLGEPGLAERRERVLHPVVASLNGSLVDTSDAVPAQWTGPRATILVSAMGRPVETTLTMVIAGNGPGRRTVTVRTAGVPDVVVSVSDRTTATVTIAVVAGPATRVELSSTGDAEAVPGSAGATVAALKVSDLRLDAHGTANSASLQQFAEASPRSAR